MALNVRPMISDRTEAARLRLVSKQTQSVIFASNGALKTLPQGTVVSYNTATNLWVEWATGGANGTGLVKGIVMNDKTDPLILQVADEAVGTVMLAGEAHRSDLQSGGGTSAQLDTALQSDARSIGIIVRSLDKIR